MKSFSRRGFQLRSASLETRIAYTGFLCFTALAAATMAVLGARVGLTPQAIQVYYLGDDSEMAFAKTWQQLLDVSHPHLLTIPLVVLVLAHLLYATPARPRVRIALTLAMIAGALLEIAMPWVVRFVAPSLAVVLLAGWLLLTAAMVIAIALTLHAMWWPRSERESENE